MRFVQHNITSLVGRHQPATTILLGKVGGEFREEARSHHVGVEAGFGFLVCETGVFGFGGEFLFDFGTNRVACIVGFCP